MLAAAVVPDSMTVRFGSAGRCTRCFRASWYLALVALLCAAGCAPDPKPFDQEVVLDFRNPGDYAITVNEDMRRLPMGSRSVRVRVSGAGIMSIIVTVYDEGGRPCGTATVNVNGDGPFMVDVTCQPDAGMPVDQRPDPGPDAGVDTRPDLMADSGPSAACKRYCDIMLDRCPSVYTSGDDCVATCAAFGWERGPSGLAQNNLECRIASALASTARDNPKTCYEAGPTGGNTCGPLCFNYCDAASRTTCDGLRIEREICVTQRCLPPNPLPVPDMALRSDSGDTFECRIFWLGEAEKDGGKSCPRLQPGAPDFPCRPRP